MPFVDHPEADRFVAAVRDGGWRAGDVLPFHQPNCWGCGPDNTHGFGLRAVAEEGDAISADFTFGDRFQGAPGLVHGGAIAGLLDDLFGFAIMRLLVPAVTAELAVSYHRPLHLGDPCLLRAEVVDRDDRDLHIEATIDQHEQVKIESRGRFRLIEFERLLNRYEPLEQR